MEIMAGIIIATAAVGGTGLIIGFLLGFAGEKFKTEVNEQEIRIREALPQNNCGGCGYAGCNALAKAIASKEARTDACPVGGRQTAEAIADIMGEKAEDSVRMVAFVTCSGTCDKTKEKYIYTGTEDCLMASVVPGQGAKSCSYGCSGYGSCVKACAFGAIHVTDGVAIVDREKCRGCTRCVSQCPKHLIEMIPYGASFGVACSSKDKGKDVMAVCETGCIACGLCVKQCEVSAITVKDQIAVIDQNLCIGCGKCATKCPKKIIHVLYSCV